MKKTPIISNYALRYATPQEIENYNSNCAEQEHYQQMAAEAIQIGGE